MNELLDLYITFVRIGCVNFGGGYAMLPLLERELVDKRHWTTMDDLRDYFSIGQCTPGIIALNVSTFIGEKKADVSFPLDHPVYVWGDEFQIEEVVTNYLSNALNHLDYDRRIEIRVGEEDGIVTTTVFNTGDPIPEKDLDRVFEKFYKVDKARTREYGGSGIGLSIVKAIMDRHHGSCGVRNYENGVAFWFTLEGKDALC